MGDRLKGKVCFVTGGASGMGRVASTTFCREGAKVVIADITAEQREAAVADARAASGANRGDCFDVPCDVTKEQEVRAAIAETVKRFGRLDVLYNNAGIMMSEDQSVIDTDEWVWDKTLAVNLKGIYLCCKYGIPAMLQSGGGSIINIASFVALVGCSVPQDAYTASKGAVIALTRSLAVQFAPQGIRTNAICPGPIETPLLTSWLLTDPEAKALRLARNPTGRFGRPGDIVNLSLYLAADESNWTN